LIVGFLVSAIVALFAVVTVTTTPTDTAPVAHGRLPRTADTTPLRYTRARAGRAMPSTTTTSRAAPLPAMPVEDTTLQSPEDVPDPSVVRPITVIGRIRIPKIGLDAELRDQITQQSIDLGPSHWPGTAMPGGFGNAVIAGHRNSHTAPFHDAANLRPGDTITIVDGASRTFNYSVTEMFVVDPSAMWITEQKPGHTLTLFTCHPLGSSSQRLVIRATLV
jgi:sortase A